MGKFGPAGNIANCPHHTAFVRVHACKRILIVDDVPLTGNKLAFVLCLERRQLSRKLKKQEKTVQNEMEIKKRRRGGRG